MTIERNASVANFYIDNIILTETQDDVYLIKDSWVTPTEGTDAMLGCEAYKDAANKDWYLKSFTRLCRDEIVGCEAMIDTQNTKEPGILNFNAGAPTSDDVTVPADKLVYVVYDENKKCSEVGCTMLGRIEPSREANDAQLGFTSKSIISLPRLGCPKKLSSINVKLLILYFLTYSFISATLN